MFRIHDSSMKLLAAKLRYTYAYNLSFMRTPLFVFNLLLNMRLNRISVQLIINLHGLITCPHKKNEDAHIKKFLF